MRTQTLVDKLANDNLLDDVQARYLDALGSEVQDLPLKRQTNFLTDAAELLGERPAQSWEVLNDALSPPESFATTWLEENPINQQSFRDRLRRGQTIATLTISLGAIIAGGWAYSYFTATPALTNNCSGAFGPVVETLEAAGETEYVMPLEIDSRYGVALCVNAWENLGEIGQTVADATIDRVYFAEPSHGPVQPVGWELGPFQGTWGNAAQNQSFETDSERALQNIVVWFEGDRCNLGTGVMSGFSALSIDYTYRGQQRTSVVDLRALYSFSVTEGQCRGLHEVADSEDDAWRSVVDSRIDSFDLINTQSVQLEPVAVSRDLCRYLRGIQPPSPLRDFEIEPLEARTVFQLEPEMSVPLIDGAVLGVCPEFASQRDALVAIAIGDPN